MQSNISALHILIILSIKYTNLHMKNSFKQLVISIAKQWHEAKIGLMDLDCDQMDAALHYIIVTVVDFN